MPRKGSMALASLLVFGTTSVVLADTNNRTNYHGLVAQRTVLMTMSNGRTWAASSFAAPQRIAGRTMAWIKLTEPGGKLRGGVLASLNRRAAAPAAGSGTLDDLERCRVFRPPPGLSLRVPSKGALSAPGGAGFILYRRANPIPYCRASWPEPSKRGEEFSHWQLNPRLSRGFFCCLEFCHKKHPDYDRRD